MTAGASSRGVPSMKDVALRAGVSLGTVSNVLNRPELVSERTRQRVQEAIAELGFVRNESARQLRGGGSRTLAYVVLGRDGGPSAPAQEAEPPPVTAPTPAAAAAVPVAPSDPTLRSGDRGVAVRDLQHALAALGYSTAVADGAFGEGTAAAVAAFQATMRWANTSTTNATYTNPVQART